jgi:hypothetical protein
MKTLKEKNKTQKQNIWYVVIGSKVLGKDKWQIQEKLGRIFFFYFVFWTRRRDGFQIIALEMMVEPWRKMLWSVSCSFRSHAMEKDGTFDRKKYKEMGMVHEGMIYKQCHI